MPESFLKRVRSKLRYYRKGLSVYGLVCRVSIDALAKVGVIVSPYYLVLEGLGNDRLPHLGGGFERYDFGFLESQDMKALAALPGRIFSEKDLLHRLKEGQKCFGVKYREEIVAFTWCSLAPYAFEKQKAFRLRENEAYLFDAYTVEQFRGVGIAPAMRYRCYQELAKLGKEKCYSITAAFNTPAMHFKRKLNAQVLESGVYVELWGRWWWQTQWRDYRWSAEHAPGMRER